MSVYLRAGRHTIAGWLRVKISRDNPRDVRAVRASVSHNRQSIALFVNLGEVKHRTLFLIRGINSVRSR